MQQNEIKELLERQAMSPVRFFESVATLKELGIERVIEIGPGKVLSGFIKKIDKTLVMSRVEDDKTLQETEALLS
jgi:[acyl-carrier-protein] S-malonyltransferase